MKYTSKTQLSTVASRSIHPNNKIEHHASKSSARRQTEQDVTISQAIDREEIVLLVMETSTWRWPLVREVLMESNTLGRPKTMETASSSLSCSIWIKTKQQVTLKAVTRQERSLNRLYRVKRITNCGGAAEQRQIIWLRLATLDRILPGLI